MVMVCNKIGFAAGDKNNNSYYDRSKPRAGLAPGKRESEKKATTSH
ncbi:hypothetical protein FBZ88_102143 [Nitrospirillum bahiense]|uniref:Uncharacterized protein n=1 Tax=Nitrospirillum amazonense TaxID=28077 RepID=A0A560G9K7_9PROT|nr:hypothetical protein FBZ88_102143 [Nitrospirillum amazonense]